MSLSASVKRSRMSRDSRIALACFALVAGMVGAAFAAVPFYDWFCRQTGYAGTTRVAVTAPIATINRGFEVRFDANVMPGLNWAFHAETPNVTLKAGEVQTINYVIENVSDHVSTGIAAYNVTPDLTGAYFNKLVCFCFTEQTLKPGERIVAPVTFFIDPAIDSDKDLDGLKSITLSYSFFPAKPKEKPFVAVPVPAPART